MPTIADLIHAHADDSAPALLFEDSAWSYAELDQASATRAALWQELRRPERPAHIGLLLDNVPDFPMWLGAAAVTGATLVGINPTRRGEELAADIRHTDCQLIVTETAYRPLLDGLDLGVPAERILDIDSPAYADRLAGYADLPLPHEPVDEATQYLLLFTSGTSGAPKACICSQGRLATIGVHLRESLGLVRDDVCYQSMPMFHSNALMANWVGCLTAGATLAMRRRFSASGFIEDVRKFDATFANYVGKPLAYILSTPERPDDADNPLRIVFGNEGGEQDIGRFARRFGCYVRDSYGSTEGGASVRRTPDMPEGALGEASAETTVLAPETGQECPPGRFDDAGKLLNPGEAIGQLVNRAGAAGFEGYWKNNEANAERVRDGIYWTGDLAYRDADGFFYFAGRDYDWLRVDGENFAAAPVERILSRHPDVALASVYAVPDPVVGDAVMAAVQLRPGAEFDPSGFADFVDTQPDMGTKWAPRFVRVGELPVTQTAKILKRQLRAEGWESDKPVWWRASRGEPYQRLTADDERALAS